MKKTSGVMRGRSRRVSYSSQINVVPYIDVMLVLLVVFMITAPLLTEGFAVDLPKADAAPIKVDQLQQRLIVSISVRGEYFLSSGDTSEQLALNQLSEQVGQILARDSEVEIFIKADHRIDYGKVITVMSALSQVGADDVGLLTDDDPDT